MPLNTEHRSLFRKRSPDSPDPRDSDQQRPRIRESQRLNVPSSLFAGSSNLINSPTFIDNSQINHFDSGATVLDILEPFITPEAAVDSSARDPPPCCHPGTRARLRGKLESWLVDRNRLQTLIWLRGPAGTGKSAVAQTFAEYADDHGRLGAAFFFSRSNKWDKPLRVIPTLVYQLASQNTEYRALLAELLVSNRLVLKAALRVQFRKLIVEPFLLLVRRSTAVREPQLIVLDGLDECEGEDAQCEIIKMITEAADPDNKLPFLWLVCSRPEPHIVFTFSAMESSIHIAREQLFSDLETRNDVDRYLRDEFKEIRAKYSDVIMVNAGQAWPSSDEFDRISDAASGLFIFAATSLKYIGDPEYANPKKQLERFLGFLEKSQKIGARSPLDTLDELYTRILSEIPDHILPTTMLILNLLLCEDTRASAQAYCNFLHLERGEFYAALRRLHAVLDIPAPEDAINTKLIFRHASFRDYLQDRARSHIYFIDKLRARTEMLKRSLYWFALPVDITGKNEDANAVYLSWTSKKRQLEWLFRDVAMIAADLGREYYFTEPSRHDLDLFSLVSQCNFTTFIANKAQQLFIDCMRALYDLDQRALKSNIIRMETGDAVDARHLQHLSILAGPVSTSKIEPAPKHLQVVENKLLYFFLGHGPARCIVCYIKYEDGSYVDSTARCYVWRGEKKPSEAEISEFRRVMFSQYAGVCDFDSGAVGLDIIRPFTTEGGVAQSSAQRPLRCHPGTRTQLNKRLESWLVDEHRLWNMIWLHGAAGTGKSAVAQSLSEHAHECGRLAATFFFSASNKYHISRRVIPTITYQLASRHFGYRKLLIQQLVDNRQILGAALHVQFKKLIVEPFSILVRSSSTAQEPLLIVLDGLDECKDKEGQCELITIISEAAQSKNLPLLWLISSRPEPHIIFTFSTMDFGFNCGREQLVLDLETRNDVNQYLRDGFEQICTEHPDVAMISTGEPWPSDNDFDQICNAASGLFIFAATALQYLGDADYANPRKRLGDLLASLDSSQGASTKSVWDTLDQLYTHILSGIPDLILPTTMRIVEFCLFYPAWFDVRTLSNFLGLEKGEFYAALQGLRVVMHIPAPEDAMDAGLTFHHDSFMNYLQDPARSHKYFIDVEQALAEMVKHSLHWCTLPVNIHRGSLDASTYARHFLWGPPERLSGSVASIAIDCLELACWLLESSEQAPDLISLISQCVFTNFVPNKTPWGFMDLMDDLYEMDRRASGSNIIRTEIGDGVDARHLQHLFILAGPTSSLKPEPAIFPIDNGEDSRILHFFLGHGPARCIVCYTRPGLLFEPRFYIWRGDKPPSEAECLKFRVYMRL